MIDYEKELNSSQYSAITNVKGPELILAGAGSGKTRTIIYRIAYMIKEKGIDPLNILAITFTNKAAKEMKTRTEELLGENCNVEISTFHSICYKILKANYKALGYYKRISICDEDDAKERMKMVLKDLDFSIKEAGYYISMISLLKDKMKGPDDISIAFDNPDLSRVYKNYQKSLDDDCVLDFDDLIFKTVQLFKENPDILEAYQEKYKYISVDEYQDTSHSQFLLVKMLASKYENICVVGDDYQSIYAFRGADISNILTFEEEYPTALIVNLNENYRSNENIVNASKCVINNNSNQIKKNLISKRNKGYPIQISSFKDDKKEASFIARNIKSLMNQYHFKASDFAILYRKNVYNQVIENALLREKIPYRIYGGLSFYQRKEIKDIIAYLKIVAGFQDSISLKRAINSPKRGIGDSTVKEILKLNYNDLIVGLTDYANQKNKKNILEFVDIIKEAQETYIKAQDGHKLESLILSVIKNTKYYEYIATSEKDEEKAEEKQKRLYNLVEVAKDYELSMSDEEKEEGALLSYLDNLSLIEDDELGKDNKDDDDKVSLMTVHKSKGLEFRVVFLMGMEEGVFPNPAEGPTEIEEDRRLCYVAITRAKDLLSISHSYERKIYGKTNYYDKSRFINELPEDNIIKKDFYY